MQDYLRTKRDYEPLRDVLLAAVRASGESVEARRDRLREVAGLCEGNLRDTEGAIAAWKQLLALDRTDEAARQSLTRALERTQRWDDLANLSSKRRTRETDLEKKLALLKRLAALHETKRKDLAAAAETWERIANLTPEDDQAIATAVEDVHEGRRARSRRAGHRGQRARRDGPSRSRGSFERLGELCEELDDPGRAGDAYADAADRGVRRARKLWDAAERCFVAAERWDRAGDAAVQRGTARAGFEGPGADTLRGAPTTSCEAADEAGALANLIRAVELDRDQREVRASSDRSLRGAACAGTSWWSSSLKRADHVSDVKKRTELRRQAADVYANQLGDKDAARETWRRMLEDGRRRGGARAPHRRRHRARGSRARRSTMLQLLERSATTGADKARIALREAELLAERRGTSKPRLPATSESSPSSTRPAGSRSRPSPTSRRRATTPPRRRTRSSAS